MAEQKGMMSRYSVYQNSLVYITGILLLYLSAAFLVPIGAALLMGEDTRLFTTPLIICLLMALPLITFFSPSDSIRPVDGIFLVSWAWVVAMLAGMVPYVLAGMSPLDASFESMSGFTTTGATIMTDIESWPSSLLLWRSFSQWLGGAGIIMVFVTILPMLGIGGRNLFKNEFPGMDVQDFTFRIREAAKEFHLIYLILSASMVALLLLMGESLYDSLNIMFATLPTGGFSTHSESIAYFSPAIQWLVIAFMFLAATNFYLHYRTIYKHDARGYGESTEFRAFALIIISLSLLTFFLLTLQSGGTNGLVDMGDTLRKSVFQIVSAMTATGFAVEDYNQWPVIIQLMIIIIMLVGGSSGSTSGGLKVSRLVLALKYIYHGMVKQIHPRAVIAIKMDGKSVGDDALAVTLAMILIFLTTLIAATLILVSTGIPVTEAFTSVSTCMTNHGPGMGAVGPYGDYSWLNPVAKITLSIVMWAGRLEIMTVLIMFTPAFWREFQRHSHHLKRVKR